MTKKLVKRKNKTRTDRGNPGGLAERVRLVEASVKGNSLPKYQIGDWVRVHVRIKEGAKERIQAFEGAVIKQKNARGVNRSFTVRKVSHGVGVERVFLESSPKIAKLEVVNSGRVRRAKLYFLREREGKAARLDKTVSQ